MDSPPHGRNSNCSPDGSPNPGFLPSPNGKKVLALVARQGRESQDLKRWWTISIPGGQLGEIDPPATLPGQTDAGTPLDWVSLDRSGQQWIIFSRPTGGSNNLFRVPVTSDGKVLSNAEQITSAPAVDFGAAASSDGRMVFSIGTVSSNLWSIPIDTNQGRVTGERQRLTQVEGVRDEGVSLSRDGKTAVFASEGRILMKELGTEPGDTTSRRRFPGHLARWFICCIYGYGRPKEQRLHGSDRWWSTTQNLPGLCIIGTQRVFCRRLQGTGAGLFGGYHAGPD